MREWGAWWAGRVACRLLRWHGTSCRGRVDHLPCRVAGWRHDRSVCGGHTGS